MENQEVKHVLSNKVDWELITAVGVSCVIVTHVSWLA